MPSPEPFIDKYLRYVTRQESPDIFHTWCAISAISVAVGRDVWYDQEYFEVYPNHFMILVAGSGSCKKSAALNIARKIIRDALPDRADRQLCPGKIYPEAMIRELQRKIPDPLDPGDPPKNKFRSLLLWSSELGSFLSKGMQQTGLPDLLTDLYDCSDEYDHVTKHAGVDHVQDVCINLMAGCTPEWMRNNMTSAIFGEGFIARTILVFADKPKGKFARLKATEEEKALRGEIVTDLTEIAKIRGEFDFDAEGGEFYDEWYDNREEGEIGTAVNSGFYFRETTHVIKLAMIFAISAGTAPTIYKPHVQAAITLIKTIRETMPLALAGAEAEMNQKNMYRVLNEVKRDASSTGITLRALGTRLLSAMDPETILKCLTGLQTNGMIEAISRKTKSGKKIFFYRTVRYVGGPDDEPEDPETIEPTVNDTTTFTSPTLLD